MSTERKPRMNYHRRKILNLLEYILETDSDIDSVYNAFALHVAQRDEDHVWVNDEEWAQWFEEYAEKLSKKTNNEPTEAAFMTAKEWDASMKKE